MLLPLHQQRYPTKRRRRGAQERWQLLLLCAVYGCLLAIFFFGVGFVLCSLMWTSDVRLLAGAGGACPLLGAEPGGSVEIVLLADIHIEKYLFFFDYTTRYLVERAVSTGNPKAVFVLGDMIDRGMAHRSTDAEYEGFVARHRRAMSVPRSQLPVHFIPGNHDARRAPNGRYLDAFGAANRAVNVSGLTVFLHSWSDFGCRECNATAGVDLLLTHFPLHDKRPSRWLRLLRRAKPRAVFSAHAHMWRTAVVAAGTDLAAPEINMGPANHFKAIHGSEGGWLQRAGYVKVFKTPTGCLYYRTVTCLPTLYIFLLQCAATAALAFPLLARVLAMRRRVE